MFPALMLLQFCVSAWSRGLVVFLSVMASVFVMRSSKLFCFSHIPLLLRVVQTHSVTPIFLKVKFWQLQARQLGGHSSEFLGSGVLLNSQVNGSKTKHVWVANLLLLYVLTSTIKPQQLCTIPVIPVQLHMHMHH
jgi:hypothetical protein